LSLIATLEKVVKDDAGLRKRLAAFLRTKSIDAADSDTWHVLLSKLAFLSSPDPTDAVVRVFSAVALYESVLLRLTESNADAGGVVELLRNDLLSFRDVIEILLPSTDQFDSASFTDLALAYTFSSVERTIIGSTRFVDLLQLVFQIPAGSSNAAILDEVIPVIVSRVSEAIESIQISPLQLIDSVQIPEIPPAVIDTFMVADVIRVGLSTRGEQGTPVLLPAVFRFLDSVGTTYGWHSGNSNAAINDAVATQLAVRGEQGTPVLLPAVISFLDSVETKHREYFVNSYAVFRDAVAVQLAAVTADYLTGIFIDNMNLRDSAAAKKYPLNGGIHSAGLSDSAIVYLEERVEEDE
jgi:hypothetical protein